MTENSEMYVFFGPIPDVAPCVCVGKFETDDVCDTYERVFLICTRQHCFWRIGMSMWKSYVNHTLLRMGSYLASVLRMWRTPKKNELLSRTCTHKYFMSCVDSTMQNTTTTVRTMSTGTLAREKHQGTFFVVRLDVSFLPYSDVSHVADQRVHT